MVRFPRDAPKRRVIRTLELLEFEVVREGNHVAMQRSNEDGSVTPLTIAYAVRAFLDPHRIFARDRRRDYGEDRSRMHGAIDGRTYVVYTMRGSAFRIISARKANAKEVADYEHNTRQD